MCGIVGAVASRNITPILVEGLKRLEYRGYDSCGVAVHADGGLKRARSTSRVAELAREVAETHLEGFTGIAHTRWPHTARPSSKTRTRTFRATASHSSTTASSKTTKPCATN